MSLAFGIGASIVKNVPCCLTGLSGHGLSEVKFVVFMCIFCTDWSCIFMINLWRSGIKTRNEPKGVFEMIDPLKRPRPEYLVQGGVRESHIPHALPAPLTWADRRSKWVSEHVLRNILYLCMFWSTRTRIINLVGGQNHGYWDKLLIFFRFCLCRPYFACTYVLASIYRKTELLRLILRWIIQTCLFFILLLLDQAPYTCRVGLWVVCVLCMFVPIKLTSFCPAMTRADSCQSLTTEARLQFQVNSCRIEGGQKGTGTASSRHISFLNCQHVYINESYFFYNNPPLGQGLLTHEVSR